MLQCLNKAFKLDPTNPQLHVAAAKYLHFYANAHFEGTVGELAHQLTDILFPDSKSASDLNAKFKSDHLNSLPHRLAVAEVNILLDAKSADLTKNWLLKSLDDDKLHGVTLKTAEQLYNGILYGKFGVWTADEVSARMS
ncbi:unnamed protein product [Anisakis simplex]|uniref:TPR_REGION domain-containing protein n=1 Tax=Anisakis simplex TaxID=6269 RepID=A0A0M3JG79_ANISI|nr:unnamed protein product [Anisakis simplex]